MTPVERESWVARISSGVVRLKLNDNGKQRLFVLRTPTTFERYAAVEAAQEAADEAQEQELYTEDQVLDFLVDAGLWDDDKQKMLDRVEKDIETLKVKLFQMAFRKQGRDTARKLLTAARKKFEELFLERHAYDHLSASGLASLVKNRYLIGCSLLRGDGKTSVWQKEDFWKSDEPLLDEALRACGQHRPSETIIRELARNEPWRTLWACRHSEGSVFGRPSVDLSDEQRFLTVWSRVYDNAYEDSECPADEILNDDDMFDGWMIIRRRDREETQKQRRAGGSVSDKIANSGEVFVVNADPGEGVSSMSAEEIEHVEALNDGAAAAIKQQRLSYLKAKGVVQEAEMPDSRQKIFTQFAQKMRGKG